MANGFIEKLDYDIDAARDAGLSESDIAQYVSSKRDYDYAGARDAGLTDFDIIQYNVAGVRDIGPARAFLEQAAFSTGEGIAATTGLRAGAGLGATVGTTFGGPVGGIIGGIVGGGLGLVGGTVAGELGERATRQALGIEGQLSRGAEIGRVGGETFGFLMGGSRTGALDGFLKKAGETTKIGRALGLANREVSPTNLGSDLMFRAAENASPKLRKTVIDGEEIFVPSGGGLLTGATAQSFFRKMGRVLNNLENKFTEFRVKGAESPGRRLAGQAVTATKIAGAGALAETLAPGDEKYRIPFELAAGFVVFPAEVALFAAESIKNAGSNLGNAERKLMREALTKTLDSVPEDIRPDIDDVIKGLRGADKPGITEIKEFAEKEGLGPVKVTAAQKTGEKFIQDLEDIAKRLNPNLANTLKREAEKSNELVSRVIQSMIDTGDPELLSRAAQIEKAYLERILDHEVEIALLKAQESADRILKVDGGRVSEETASKAGEMLVNAEDTALKSGRAMESMLYDSVPNKDVPVIPSNVRATFLSQLQAPGGTLANLANMDSFTKSFMGPIIGEQGTDALNLPAKLEVARKDFDEIELDLRDSLTDPDVLNTLPSRTTNVFLKEKVKEIRKNRAWGEYTMEEDLRAIRGKNAYSVEDINKIVDSVTDDLLTRANIVMPAKGQGKKSISNLLKTLRTMPDDLKDEFVQIDFKDLTKRYNKDGIAVFPNTEYQEQRNMFGDRVGKAKNRIVAEGTSELFQNYEEVLKKLQRYVKRSQDFKIFESEALQAMSSLEGDLTPITLGEMLTFRKNILARARQARANNDSIASGFYSIMADAALNDMNLGKYKDLSVLSPEELENALALQTAFNFSRTLNDKFTRAFSGELLSTTKTGRQQILPELAVEKMLSGSGLASYNRYQQMHEAIDFIQKEVGGGDPNAPIFRPTTPQEAEGPQIDLFREQTFQDLRNQVNGGVETFVRYKLGEVFDTPNLSPQALANRLDKFNYDYRNFITSNPDLQKDLSDLSTAQTAYAMAVADQAAQTKASYIKNQTAFGKFLNAVDNPGSTLSAIIGIPGKGTLNKPAAFTGFDKLAQSVKQTEKDVPGLSDGFKSTVYEVAFQSSTGKDGRIDYTGLEDYLFSPLARNKESVMQVLQRRGFLAEGESKKWKDLIEVGKAFDRTLSSGSLSEADAELLKQSSYLKDVVASFLGVNLLKTAVDKIPLLRGLLGESITIQEASIASNYARRVLSKLPQSKGRQLFYEAISDPELMADILEGKGYKESTGSSFKRKFDRALNTVFGTTAARYLTAELDEPSRSRSSEEDTSNVVTGAPTPSPRTPPRAPVATPPAPPPAAPVASAPPPPPTGNLQESRQRFAQLYPFDVTSDIIRSTQS